MTLPAARAVDLTPHMDDRAVLQLTRRSLRNGDGALIFSGSLDVQPDDSSVFVDWVNLLVSARQLLCLAGSGEIGPRGLALALACDLAVVAPDTSVSAQWRMTPALTALAGRRLGPIGMRSLLLHAGDPLRCLCDLGHVLVDPTPAKVVEERLLGIGGPRAAAALRQNMRAAEELPYAEASDFELWSHKLQQGTPA